MDATASSLTGTAWHSTGHLSDFDHWADRVARSYTALTVTPPPDGPHRFTGEIAVRDLGADTTLSRIRAQPQKVRRRKQDIARAPSPSVFINLQIAGRCRVNQAGLESLQKPGTAILLDARRPFMMQFDGAFEQVCLHLPLRHLTGITPAAGRLMRSTQGATADLFAALIQPENLSLDRVLATLRHAYRDPVDQRLSDDHLAMIQHFIRAHYADRDLSVATVARRFSLSKRYVHRLFARTDHSFGQYLLGTRVAVAQQMIEADATLRVHAIAQACGFATASHFSRSYKAAHGISPQAAIKR